MSNKERYESFDVTKVKEINKKANPIYLFFKRIIDIVASFLGLVVLSWLFLIIGIIIKCTSKGPVFYGHKRVGKNGKIIKIWKFRSMVIDSSNFEKYFTPEQMEEYKQNYKVKDDPRITKIGKFLRKTSLDELPQLINILVGQLSIVGPRPVLEEETQLYGENRDLLLSIRPGLTGYWQANGRSNTTYEERIKMELYYVKYRSAWMDIVILFKTLIGVFKGEGI